MTTLGDTSRPCGLGCHHHAEHARAGPCPATLYASSGGGPLGLREESHGSTPSQGCPSSISAPRIGATHCGWREAAHEEHEQYGLVVLWMPSRMPSTMSTTGMVLPALTVMLYSSTSVVLLVAACTGIVLLTILLWMVVSTHHVLIHDVGCYDAGIASTSHAPHHWDSASAYIAVLVVLQEMMLVLVVPVAPQVPLALSVSRHSPSL